MQHLSAKASRKLINIATVVCGIIIILLVIYWYRLGIFTDQAKMRAYLANKQIVGPIIFVLIQIVQVVVPIIPGGVSLLGGVVFFGPIAGFIYNYVGICKVSFQGTQGIVHNLYDPDDHAVSGGHGFQLSVAFKAVAHGYTFCADSSGSLLYLPCIYYGKIFPGNSRNND